MNGLVLPLRAGPDQSKITDYVQRQEAPRREDEPAALAALATPQKQIRRGQRECPSQEVIHRAAKRRFPLTAEEHSETGAQRAWSSVVQQKKPRQGDLHKNHPATLCERVKAKACRIDWDTLSLNDRFITMDVLVHLPDVIKACQNQMSLRQLMHRNSEAVAAFDVFDGSHSHLTKFNGRLADRLTSCTTLDLSYNNFTSFPEELKGTEKADKDNPGLEALTRLDVSHNRIPKLPDFFAERFMQLRVLNLSHNKFQKVPKEIGPHMKKITKLDLSYNQIRSTMKAMKFLTSGQHIFGCVVNLDGNPLFNVKPIGETILKDMGAIRDPENPNCFTLEDQPVDLDFDELD